MMGRSVRTGRMASLPGHARVLAVVLPLMLVVACGGDKAGTEDDAAADVYTVRGIIERLPRAEGGDKSLYIRHAPIPAYKNEHGETVGMKAMTMPFPVGDGVALGDLVAGDKVEFTFAVSWQPPAGYEITSIRKLPQDTEIDFEE